MKRKIIQIFVGNGFLLGALCDDGSVWLREKDNKDAEWNWTEVDISQLNSTTIQQEEAV